MSDLGTEAKALTDAEVNGNQQTRKFSFCFRARVRCYDMELQNCVENLLVRSPTKHDYKYKYNTINNNAGILENSSSGCIYSFIFFL